MPAMPHGGHGSSWFSAMTENRMRTIALPWETWRAVIAVLREKAVPSMLEHANMIEEQLERHGPGEPRVRLSLTDDVFLRSYNWARWQLRIPLPVDG